MNTHSRIVFVGFFIAIISIFFASVQFTYATGAFEPGATLDPNCTPGSNEPNSGLPCQVDITEVERGIGAPASTPTGPAAIVYVNESNGDAYTWDGSAWNLLGGSGGITTLAAIGSSPNANGATISGSTLNLEPASASFGGVVTTGAQTLAGAKTFSSAPTFSTMTQGSVFFAGTSGLLSQDNASFFFDDSTDRLGILDATPVAALTVGSGDLFQVNSSGAIAATTGYIQGSGTMSLTSANTTQGTTSSIFALNGNSLTSGTGFYAASSTLSSGPLMSLVVNSTDAVSNTQKALNISTGGVNTNPSQRTYGAYIINSHSGTSSTNVGLYASASGATNNYAALFPAGNVGIGISSPTSTLDVLGQISAVESLNAASSTTSLVHYLSTTLSATANTTGSSYVGSESLLTWNGGAFDATSAGSLGMSASLSYAETASGTSGTIDLLVGANGFAVHNGSGTVSRLRGNRFSALNAGTGAVTDLTGTAISAQNTAGGAVTMAYGSNIELTNRGAGTMTGATGNDVSVIASAGAITTSHVLDLRTYMNGSGSITNATGIGFEAGLRGLAYESGIEAANTAIGINFTSSNDGLTDYAAIDGTDVYGIYFGDKSLDGSTSEYALYLNDAEAENYFINGVRIGADADANKFASSSNGASSTVMYIGNETIDTSVSDRRLKDNISETNESALNFLGDFSVVSFDWLDENNRHDQGTVPFGLIAQEVQEIAPQYVRAPEDSSSYMSVRFGDLVPATIKAIQELKLQFDEIVAFNAGEFMQNLIAWLGNVSNGITNIFSEKITTTEICVADEQGETCLTRAQVDQLLQQEDVVSDEGSDTDNDDNDNVNDNEPETLPGPEVSLEDPLNETEPVTEELPDSDISTDLEPAPEPDPAVDTPPQSDTEETPV